jgi:CubicO group peptidase (beta-lactamase class C family)
MSEDVSVSGSEGFVLIDRRTVIAAGLAAGVAGPSWGGPTSAAKQRAIEAIQLPASFNGVLGYGRNGKVEHIRCVGMADVEAGKPVTPQTRFKWGSASKWVTSVTALRLVEQGRLSLDAPIITYLPDFRRDTGERVLVEHLLSNTSGVPDLMSRQLSAEPALRTSTASPAEIVARFGGGDLAFTPGQGWDYSALNWVIVAALLQRLTGEPLATLVAQSVFRPLGMRDTGFAQADQPPMPQLAAAYASATPPVRKMRPVPSFVAASGNVASKPTDAMRAAHGIFHGGLISSASRSALTSIRWPAEDYALGGRVHRIDDDPWAWETGKVEGYRAHIAHRLSRSETMVIFDTTDMSQSIIGNWIEAVARA